MNIKKKLMTLSVILAMAVSFSACSDEGSSSQLVTNTLSSEELNLVKHDLEIVPFNPGGDQDNTSQNGGTPSADNNNNQGGQDGSSTADNNSPGTNTSNQHDGDTQQGGNDNQQGDNTQQGGNNNQQGSNTQQGGNDNQQGGNTQQGGNDNQQGGNTQQGGNGNQQGGNNTTPGSVGDPASSELQVISGNKVIMQAFWTDITKGENYVFNGEYLTANFKIKDGTANGIYPVTIEHADFANYDAETIKFSNINGAVIVGGTASENTFSGGSEPELMVTNASGKPGDTVTVKIMINNNPGVVGNVLRFGYNSDALEYVGGGEGADFNGHFK